MISPDDKLQKRKLPDFFCVGVQKSGTTWVYNQLIQHPQVKIPLKEISFLNNPKGNMFWYYSLFSSCENYISGDMTPDYFLSPLAAYRIRKLGGKTFVILRDPRKRAISHYKFYRKRGIFKLSFKETFDLDLDQIKTRGNYLSQLKLFPNIKIYFFEEIMQNKEKFILDLESYLGLNEFIAKDLYFPVLKTTDNENLVCPEYDLTSLELYLNKDLKTIWT